MSPAGEERHSEHFENIAILLTHDMIQASQEVFRDTGKIAQFKRVHCFLRLKRQTLNPLQRAVHSCGSENSLVQITHKYSCF